jgi:hypothetical protein
MVRRFAVSVVTIGIALFFWSPRPATATTPHACWLGGPPALPEPQPIQVDRATVDRATAALNAIAQNAFDLSQLATELQNPNVARFFELGATVVSGYGAPQTMSPFEQQLTANGTSTYFRVTFPKGTLTWVMTIDSQNKIAGLSLRRTAVCKIFNITARADVLY